MRVIQNLQKIETGYIEVLQLVVSAIQDTQRLEVSHLQPDQPVIIGIEGLKIGQAGERNFLEAVETGVQIFKAGQCPDVQVGQRIAVAVEINYLAGWTRVGIADARPERKRETAFE